MTVIGKDRYSGTDYCIICPLSCVVLYIPLQDQLRCRCLYEGLFTDVIGCAMCDKRIYQLVYEFFLTFRQWTRWDVCEFPDDRNHRLFLMLGESTANRRRDIVTLVAHRATFRNGDRFGEAILARFRGFHFRFRGCREAQSIVVAFFLDIRIVVGCFSTWSIPIGRG